MSCGCRGMGGGGRRGFSREYPLKAILSLKKKKEKKKKKKKKKRKTAFWSQIGCLCEVNGFLLFFFFFFFFSFFFFLCVTCGKGRKKKRKKGWVGT